MLSIWDIRYEGSGKNFHISMPHRQDTDRYPSCLSLIQSHMFFLLLMASLLVMAMPLRQGMQASVQSSTAVFVCVSCTTGWQKVLVVHLSIMAVIAFEALSALGFFCVIPNGLQAGPCLVVSSAV